MYLEDVYVEGFKSFSQRTEMSFQPGISVIIGNNGAGKSNILDALIWAMGEDDLRRLRCYDTNDLFFAGSGEAPPANRMRVELHFKPHQHETVAPVQVTRELTREGQSTYRMGDRNVTRLAYTEALTQLNLRDTLKTIIKQEQINHLLELDPVQRYARLQHLMAAEDRYQLDTNIINSVAPRFASFLRHLFPEAQGRLYTASRNGTSAVDIDVELPGHLRRKAHQLSGGQKAVTSLALQLAIFNQLQSPLFLMDEVEPALDYTHHKAMQRLLRHLAQDKQLIMITHLRSTIELADTVHGVRTRRDGTSFMKFYFVMDERLLKLYKCC